MSTLLEELKQVQPCDSRGLIQILSQRIIRELIETKRAACEEVANTFNNYGLTNIYPCDYLTEEFLNKLTTGDPIAAISSVLVKAGYPPHLLKIFTKGFDELTDEELQEVFKWTEPITGIQVHEKTGQYFRGQVQIETNLQTFITQQNVTKTKWVDDEKSGELIQETDAQATARQSAERELRALQELQTLPLRMVEIITNTGPKIEIGEWTGSKFTSELERAQLADFVFNYGNVPFVAKRLAELKKLGEPVEKGGFGVQGLWTRLNIESVDALKLDTIEIVAKRQVEVTYTEKVDVEVTRPVEVRTYSGLSKEERLDVEKSYLDQGIRSLVSYLSKALYKEVFSKITCPAPAVLNKLITRIQNLAKIIGKLKERLTLLSQFLNIASATVSLINTIIDKLKVVIASSAPAIITLSVTPITRGIAVVLNKIIQVCQTLINKYEPRVEKLDKSLCAATKGMTFIVANINVIDAFIQVIDSILQNCVQDQNVDLGIVTALTPITYGAQGISYRGFEIEIRIKPSNEEIKQRYAVALDSNKVIILQGPYSFSADADILIDELKYRIDTYLG